MGMDIAFTLCLHSRFPCIFRATSRQIVVAHEEPRRGRQRQNPAQRLEQLPRISAGKIRARRAVIGHEHCVACEHGVTNDIGNVRRRMTGDMEDGYVQLPNLEVVAIGKKLIKI